jgi:hypothetical protein
MNEQDYNQLRELSWRRPLTAAEAETLQKYLSAHPAALTEWEDETALNQLLERVPAAPPVASNFTARVLQTVKLETAAENRESVQGLSVWQIISRWLPKAAFACVLLAVGVVGYHERQVNERVALAKNVVEFTAAVSASDPEAMQDFEPIRRLSDNQPKADTELLALMK